MKRLCYIVLSVLLTLPMVAQTNPPTPAAGYDFYFTLFDHWNENGNAVIQTNKYCGFTVCTIEAGDDDPAQTPAGNKIHSTRRTR